MCKISAPPCPVNLSTRRGLARKLRVEHRGLIDEGCHDSCGLLHVVRLYALVRVLRRVVRARVVLNLVLYELETGESNRVEGDVVCAARVRERQGLRARIREGR